MKSEAITLIKEDVLSMGRMVDRTVEEVARLLRKEPTAGLAFIEEQEDSINKAFQQIEERCLDLLLDRDTLGPTEIRTLVTIPIIASKFERLADHANRVGRLAVWAEQDKIDIPQELAEMAQVVHRMVQDVLLSFLTDGADKVNEILQRDSQVNYLHDVLSKKLLSDLGEQESAKAQMRAQFLFCARFLERMGDACTSIAKRIYFIVTGERMRPEASVGQ